MNKYREAFAKKLGDRLMKFPVEKLNTIITKIDAMTEKIEANTDMDETKKEKLLAQLEALRALIQDAIDEKENSIDIESLLE